MTDNQEKPVEGEIVNEGRTMSPHDEKCKTYATVVYALQALSFLFGITYLAAIIVNYVKSADVEGTWLESHFRWQRRTFWFSVLWGAVGILSMIALVGYFILLGNLIWVIYRIAKGWMNLHDNKEMPS